MDTDNKTLIEVANAMIQRIDTTTRTDEEVFRICQNYITAAHYMLNGKADSNEKNGILMLQLLAKQLATYAPLMLKGASYEFEQIVGESDK